MLKDLFFALGLANNVLLIAIFLIRRGGVTSLLRQVGIVYLLLAIPAVYGLYLVPREGETVRYSIFLGIFLAFLALECVYDFVLHLPFRESWNWKLLAPYLCLYYAMNYGFVVMVWKNSARWRGVLMLGLFVVQIVANIATHPRKGRQETP